MAKSNEAVAMKEPHGLSPRIRWLRDYYFAGVEREWNNEWISFTTGKPWDVVYNELSYYIVPETYAFFPAFRASTLQSAHVVPLPDGFFKQCLPLRRAWFIKEVMVNHLPHEILPGDLIAGGRFNILASQCLTKREAKEREAMVEGPKGSRLSAKWFHDHGYGNSGATSGHLIPDPRQSTPLGVERHARRAFRAL